MPTAEIEAVAARLTETGREMRDLIVLLTRLESDNGSRTSLDDLLQQFGYTRDELERIPDDD